MCLLASLLFGNTNNDSEEKKEEPAYITGKLSKDGPLTVDEMILLDILDEIDDK